MIMPRLDQYNEDLQYLERPLPEVRLEPVSSGKQSIIRITLGRYFTCRLGRLPGVKPSTDDPASLLSDECGMACIFDLRRQH